MVKSRIYIVYALMVAFIFVTTAVPVYGAKKTNSPPTATNVSISGSPSVGQILTGSYKYNNSSGIPEGISTYRWLYSTSLSGTYYAISGAASKTYKLTSNDAGRYIKFEVTPIAARGASAKGTPVQSAAVGPVVLPASTKVVLGFAVKYYSTDVSSYNSMVNNTKSMDQIATVSYTADSYGNLTGTAPSDQINYANNNGIKTLALVTNSDSNGFNSSIARSILENPANSQTLINNLVNVVKANGYKGVNVDFENIPYTDRQYYTQFISNLKNALAPLGYLTTISVPAKTADSPTNSWNGAFDYSALGAIADEILLMTYDEHGSWSTAGPVASIGWVTNVVNYAKAVIPPNKILLGLAAYGYDWSSAGNKALSLKTIDSLVTTYGGAVQWDSASQSPYYTYTDTNGAAHTIWFENSASIGYKCDLVNQNNLLGAGVWRLGLENQAFWGAINTKFGR